MKFKQTAAALVAGFPLLIAPVADAVEPAPRGLKLRPSTERTKEKEVRWKTLDEAVSAGVVDAQVVRALERRGSVKGLVQFDADAEIAAAVVGGSARIGSVERSLAVLPDRLHEVKQKLFGKVPGLEKAKDYEFLPSTLVEFTSSGSLLRSLNNASVEAVRHDAKQKMMLADSLRLIGQPTAVEAGFGGGGAAVAILDTGVDYRRAAFGSCSRAGEPGCRVIATRDLAPADGRLDTGHFHGTNVSGIAAAVAPDAQLLVGDVFKGSSTRPSWINDGIDWAIRQKKNGVDVRAINLSLGIPFTYFNKPCYSSPFTSAFRTARSLGVLPVVAAGNFGFDFHRSHGFHSGVAMPACTPGALSVAATYDSDMGRKAWPIAGNRRCVDRRTRPDKVVCWTQSGRTVGLFAPGAYITAAGIRMPGTSQAAPHVAGAAAVLGAAYPAASVSQIESALKNSGPHVYDPGPEITRRRLDISAAIDTLLAGVDAIPPRVTAPVQFLPEGMDVIPPDVPVGARWSGSDAGGIYDYALQVSENGTLYSVPLETRTTSETVLDLVPGNRYQFAVAARDNAGNWSDWSYGPEFVADVYQENHPAVTYSAGWERLPWSEAWDGYQMSSLTPDASSSLTFAGSDVAWVGTAGPDNGFADFSVDGVAQEGVDTFDWDLYPRLILASRHWHASGQHSLALNVLGDGQVDVDSFIVLRPATTTP